jgi:putative hydrolase of the HAD superfamily
MRAKAITFDATGTLIHSPRRVEIYAEVLGRHGVPAPPAEVRRLMAVVWQELDCRAEIGRDRFSAHPEGPRGWWRRFLERLVEHLGASPPGPFAAAELYHRFGEAAAWEVYPEVPAALAELAGRGFALGVVSNWDERLAPLLGALGLGEHLSAVVASAEVGVEKPDPRIFLAALARLGVEPREAVHVGDRRRDDVEGAQAAGMGALHLVRPGPASVLRPARRPPGRGDLADLASLPERVSRPPAALRSFPAR